MTLATALTGVTINLGSGTDTLVLGNFTNTGTLKCRERYRRCRRGHHHHGNGGRLRHHRSSGRHRCAGAGQFRQHSHRLEYRDGHRRHRHRHGDARLDPHRHDAEPRRGRGHADARQRGEYRHGVERRDPHRQCGFGHDHAGHVIAGGTVNLAGGTDQLILANGVNSATVSNVETITEERGPTPSRWLPRSHLERSTSRVERTRSSSETSRIRRQFPTPKR